MKNSKKEVLECLPDTIQIIPDGYDGYITSGVVTNCVIMKAEYEFKGHKVFAMGHFYRGTHQNGDYQKIISDFEKITGLSGGDFRIAGENIEFREGNKNVIKTFEMTSKGVVIPKTTRELSNIQENSPKFYK